jgi:peptidyl-dipeptidase Dcp
MKLYHFIVLSLIIATTACNQEGEKQNDMSNNPLLQEWNTPFGVPPFDKIKNSDYLPAFRYAMQEQNENIAVIINNQDVMSFDNTIVAFELSGLELDKVSNVFFAVESANTNDELKETAKTIAPELSAHYDGILLNDALFERVKAFNDQSDHLDLNSEQKMLLSETYKDFVRAGANLKDTDKVRMTEINSRMAVLSQQFGDNLLTETNVFELHVNNEADLGNLPTNLVAVAANEAKARDNKSGWSFTLQRPSINPFLQSSPNRDYREQMFIGYAMRGNNDNKSDNKAILQEMANLRLESANLLGYKTHADYVLDNSMAKSPEAVYSFMDKLWTPALEMAKSEREILTETMHNAGIRADFEGSDWRYYVEKVRENRYNFNEEETRPYFEFTAVMDGAFMLAERLFGLTFVELDNVPTWHSDQKVFEVFNEDGSHLGIIYMDFFARESKRGGAWMNEIRMQSNIDEYITPIVTNNFNFPPATKDGPSLLSFSEAQTLFHEFGHGLHGLFSNVTYASLSGTNVPRDFVEFPSQVMENWMSEPEVLKLYAKHYQTGEVIPDDMIERMNAANIFNMGFATVEYMAAAYLDMAWHTITETEVDDVRVFEADEMNRIGLIPEILPRYRSTYFAHIFSGGYSSGYYSYLWSEVLDADAFAAFKEAGIFDKELAARYRTMLSKGGSEPGMDLYVEFRGQEPVIEPLLVKKGLK